MLFHRRLLGFVLAAVPAMASAQLDAPVRSAADSAIVVTGKRLGEDGKPIPMSEWRVAETEHVLFYARADDRQAARVARNLERLHFLLSVLLNRVDRQDDTIKLSVTQIGDGADFGNLRLGNARWQEGPFPDAFPQEFYYDPRDDGPVLATTRTDQKIVLQQGRIMDALSLPGSERQSPELAAMGVAPSLAQTTTLSEPPLVNEISFQATAEGRLYSGFAQHYLLTYFPAAYPRWYLDGFGEIFATFAPDKDGELEYGRAPEGYRKVLEWYGSYRIGALLDGRYLAARKSQTRWTPYHAWALVHLLFFSEEWRKPLHDYLQAVASGESPAQAAKALGDPARLQKAWSGYRGRKMPYEKLTYPAGRFGDPLVRRLTRDQADFLMRRLVLGARVTIPAPRYPGDERPAEALRARSGWLEQLGRDANANPGRSDLQLLWSEGACRSEAWTLCLDASNRALAVAPQSGAALAWKGLGLAGAASALAEPQRSAQLTQARGAISRANRADTEATLPLLAYYRTYRDSGSPPPDLAVLGLVKAGNAVPAASSTRLILGEALAARGNLAEARLVLLPVAIGAYDTPERARAVAILSRIDLQGLDPLPRRNAPPAP